MTNQIEEIKNALDENLKTLNEAKGLTMADVKWLLLELIGTVRDMWERFETFFIEMDRVNKINKATEKGEKYEDNTDVKKLYI